MDEKYKEFLEKKAEKYDKKNVIHTVKILLFYAFLHLVMDALPQCI